MYMIYHIIDHIILHRRKRKLKGKAGLIKNEAEKSTNHQSNLQYKIFDGFF